MWAVGPQYQTIQEFPHSGWVQPWGFYEHSYSCCQLTSYKINLVIKGFAKMLETIKQ